MGGFFVRRKEANFVIGRRNKCQPGKGIQFVFNAGVANPEWFRSKVADIF